MKYPEITLGRIEAVWNKLGGEDGVNHFLSGDVQVNPCTNIFEPASTVTIPATNELFVSKSKFVVNMYSAGYGEVRISKIDPRFIRWFLLGEGKFEKPVGEHALRYSQLRKATSDVGIISGLGGEAKAETFLSDVYGLMSVLDSGKLSLPNDGWSRIFYVRDSEEILRVILASHFPEGWHITAIPLGSRHQSEFHDLVFSRVA